MLLKVLGHDVSKSVDVVDLARRAAVLEMSMFYLNRVFQMTNQKVKAQCLEIIDMF
jgi:hypothetical protein